MAIEKRRVLAVDDDPELLQLVIALLKRINIETIGAENAVQAAQILRQPPLPDLLILDLMLPDISGIDFLKQMRARPIFDNLPVLVLSALAEPQEIRAALDAGADRYLTKPYLATNLLSVVQEVLRTGRRVRD
ncbi:MAG: response regulator [Anaerolinea sp.]|nr:response regulator [Anaerolinea sp.]